MRDPMIGRNTPLLSRSFATESRQQLHRKARVIAREKLEQQYRRGRETHQWPVDMGRRARHRIITKLAKRLFVDDLQKRLRPMPKCGLSEFQKERQAARRSRVQ
jgi:hypothetical protein